MDLRLTRRDFVRAGSGLALAGLAGSVITACDALSTAPAGQGGGSDAGSGYAGKEAPMLADLVKQGKLPALAQRVPAKPAVLKPLVQKGLYGGTFRRAVSDPTDAVSGQTFGYAGLVQWAMGEVKPIPGLAESWDVANQGRTYTFHLRSGLRWSDGQPFTADDLVFVFQNVFGNKSLMPVFPTWLVSSGHRATLEKVDETTVRISFPEPNNLLLKYLAYPSNGASLLAPRHYLSKFHPDFTPQAQLDAQAKQAGFASWDRYFVDRNTAWTNPDLPVLGPWRMVTPITGSNSHAVMERNPYYWKVDPDGRQLPYVDRVTFDLVQDQQTLALRASNGELDFQDRSISFSSATVLIKNGAQKGYQVYRWSTDAPWVAMYMNQSHLDPVMRKLMQDIRFRHGLSVAINRKEMNDALFAGQGTTTQPDGIAGDEYYEKSFGHTFTDYDERKANQLLDSAGLDRKDGQGVRLRPDGKPLSLTILTFPYETGVNAVDAYEFVKRYWERVGVPTNIQNVQSTLWQQKVQASQHDIAGYTVAGFLWDINAVWYVPIAATSYWAPLFGSWYASGGATGEEPPPELRKLQQLYDQMVVTSDDKKRLDLGRQILGAHNQNVWIIGSIGMPFQPLVVNDDLVNVPRTQVESFRLGHEAAADPEQIFYKHPGKH